MMALFSAFHSASSAEFSLKTFNVSAPAVPLLQTPSFFSIDAGALKKYGMDLRYIVTAARTIQALVGGSVHFAQASKAEIRYRREQVRGDRFGNSGR